MLHRCSSTPQVVLDINFLGALLFLVNRLWTWLVWVPSARQCFAWRPALCLLLSATYTCSKSLSCEVTILQWMRMKMRKRRRVSPGHSRSTLRPPAWVFAGTLHAITALRSIPTWLTLESDNLLLLVRSPNTSSKIYSLTPATGWCKF